ncbi:MULTISPECIES: GNAT family N-acetyltransferase [unclassified Bacillus (in: firmicutes)]|uniref:GNAT family N-acetyltransferase n=1 Tax=unclassified Bacillus (in: firmicutes) TaxID=185979 RepID=UPI000BEFBF76|nr:MULTISPECIES: GNAT family N-acetyltransferase [unclassified Bacillus (in: firmicutes)]PEJ56751.1 GNAT family N-acetyltransferase [Bacillus sp. AFS002410]PEK98539.1 GNAT family N-acetyltransferase [Bacillus sp. AFS017336]
MKIRLLTKEDAEIYLNIRLEGLKKNPEVFSTTMDEILDQDDPVEYKAEILDENYTIGAFTDKGELIGVATLRTFEKVKAEHKGKIESVYVSSRARKMGAGYLLIEEVIHLAKSLGLEQLTLNIIEGNETAKNLYEKLGFKTFAKTPNSLKLDNEYWDQEHMILMLEAESVGS